MNRSEILERYIEICREKLVTHQRALRCLEQAGVTKPFVFESYRIGFSDGTVTDFANENQELAEALERAGIIENGRDRLRNCIIIPILDETKTPVNLVGYSIYPQRKPRMISLNDEGVFNGPYLRHVNDILLTQEPLHALALIEREIPNTTFVFGDEGKFEHALRTNATKRVTFLFDGYARLYQRITSAGISARRLVVPVEKIIEEKLGKEAILERIEQSASGNESGEDAISEIENGFLFRLPLVTYRVIGSFTDATMSMKANIKATRDEDIFVDSIDLYKHRDRQRFLYNLMDRLNIRDQMQLESDFTMIISVIEKHKEKRAQVLENATPALTDHQRSIGRALLEDKHLCHRIEEDYEQLGYVQERKNKLLLYLVMTSRLMRSPLHALLIARSGAGKSMLAEITAELCPPEQLQMISDLSAQSLYYFGENDLAHHFVCIGERHGTEGAEYPLRELISRKSITKAIPMKDPATGVIKTAVIRVNGPISLVETATDAEINPENLNRCFVIGIDESEEQTGAIHSLQRTSYTFDGYLAVRNREDIVKRHRYAQQLLGPIQVFNPFAESLTFPTSKLRSRRDNDKFLRLISAICFLHQYQRKLHRASLPGGEQIEYIECSLEDYRIAYELLADGVLENTLDDLPSPARKLLDLIVEYLGKRSTQDGVPPERIVFERKDIREYTSWSFAQVRNNFRILKDYEYIQLVKQQNGLAHQYRLSGGYLGVDLLHTILSPDQLAERLRSERHDRSDEVRESAPTYALSV
jgi:hypothetical protein